MNNLPYNLWKRDLVLLVLLLTFATFSACDSSGPGSGVDPAEDDPVGAPSTIIVTPSEVTIEVDSTHRFTAEVKDEQGNTLQDVSVTWESDNETIATVDEEGQATGVAEGSASIVASTSEISGSATLEVKETPKSWHGLGGGFNYYVHALSLDAQGNLIAGGMFTKTSNISEVIVNGIARWNGTSWEPIGSGFHNISFTLSRAVDVVTTDANGNLIAGGGFKESRDDSVIILNGIARWNGSSWEAIGQGFDRGVRALIIDNSGDLIAGGQFMGISTLEVRFGRIARWNGNSWEPIGSGLGRGLAGSLNATVRDLAIARNGDLIAGGDFIETGNGVEVNNIARWDGNSWKTMGHGFDGSVFALTVAPNGDIIAGGNFSATVDGLVVNSIARWNGSSWEAFDIGLTGTVRALSFDANGDLIAAGEFTQTSDGKLDLRNIARWNGNTWEGIGSGLGNIINAITFDADGDLIAGGNLTRNGDGSVTQLNNVARWGIPEE